MNENDNLENTDAQEDAQSCCSDSGNCASKMKYAAFGIVMLLAVGVAAHALIEKHKNPAASTCGTSCTPVSDQAQSSDGCGSKSSCDSAPAPKETSTSCPMQKADAKTCSKDSAASGCPTESKTCPSEKKCCGSDACKDKAKTDGEK